MTDLPQFRLLSTNTCPNKGVVTFGLQSTDLHVGPTTWGYCGWCWTQPGLIPPAWVTRVGDRLEVPFP